MTRPRWRWLARSRSRWAAPRLRAPSICCWLTRGCWSARSASRICGRCVRGWGRWPTRSIRSRCKSRSSKAMLDSDPEPPSVFFVDEHFVAYTGSRPVAKGWNTRRRHAEPGRHETVLVDDRWRAVCFSSGPPQGLATGMLGPLDQLREICGERPLMIGFDRGGSYPKVFSELRDRGLDWVSYRRAPLATRPSSRAPRGSRSTGAGTTCGSPTSCVELDGYGAGAPDHSLRARPRRTADPDQRAHHARGAPGASAALPLVHREHLQVPRSSITVCTGSATTRWRSRPTPRSCATPSAPKLSRCSEATKRPSPSSSARSARTSPPRSRATSKPTRHSANCERTSTATRNHARAARAALKPIPAKLPANIVNPDAQRATPRVNRRALQTVCRLLAYNAELDLARALNTYLTDPDEYRAITRNLLHQPGHIHYTPTSITVTIDKPHAPRIARALTLLIDQLNNNPPKLPGDTRKITYSTTTS